MVAQLQLGDMAVEVAFKDIKNVHLSVHPPAGRVSISAPQRMKLETVRVFAISKLDWIRQQQKKIRSQEREPQREYLERESHYIWGKRYLLSVVERDEPPSIELKHNKVLLHVRPETPEAKREAIVEAWYREQIKQAVPELIAKWESQLNVKVAQVFIQRMKTKWGSCNHIAGNIRLNTDLAKKPRECLEYIVVHEMIHILEPTHNELFQAYVNNFMPDWKHRRQILNRLPVRHEEWEY